MSTHTIPAGVLSYFGEDPAMTSTAFFGTLNKFVAAFDSARESDFLIYLSRLVTHTHRS